MELCDNRAREGYADRHRFWNRESEGACGPDNRRDASDCREYP